MRETMRETTVVNGFTTSSSTANSSANAEAILRGGLYLVASLLLSACAWVQPDPAALPRAELLGIRELDRDGGETRHQVTLRLSNPSDRELQVAGLSCYVHVDGVLAAEGHAGPLAPLPPASATRILIETRSNVLGGLKLMTGMSEPASRQYRLDVRLRRPWRWWPLEIKAAGEVMLDR